MNILALSHADLVGGAAIAAYRLHDGLRRIGVSSRMAVQWKTSTDPDVFQLSGYANWRIRQLRWRLDRAPRKFYPRRDWVPFSSNYIPSPLAGTLNRMGANILHLHWVGNGMLPISSWAKLRQPVVWTLHDSWAFTGGCHVPHDCRRYDDHCGRCPILASQREHDLSWWIWRAKERALHKMRPVIVSPSNWMTECARRSSLLGQSEIHTIPHGLDLDVFRLSPRAESRITLGLPADRPLIAFGAMFALEDKNKGADLLLEALGRLEADADLLIFGSDRVPEGLSRRAYAAGTLNDESRMARVYAAADVFVVPSRSESFSLTTLESLACGTPVVAFRIGGIPDLIEHQVNGYLAEPFDTEDLARGIAWVLEDPERHARLRAAARAKAEREYEITHIARRYLALYEDILSRPR